MNNRLYETCKILYLHQCMQFRCSSLSLRLELTFCFLQNLVFIVVGIGILFSAIFHLGLKERKPHVSEHSGVIVNGDFQGFEFDDLA